MKLLNLNVMQFGGSRLPAIALTAFGRPEDRAKSLANGYQAHLSKPVDLELLRRTIARLAGQLGR